MEAGGLQKPSKEKSPVGICREGNRVQDDGSRDPALWGTASEHNSIWSAVECSLAG